jgi:GNAT superfamily N-acetyltransferase
VPDAFEVLVRPLVEDDLDDADHTCRVAFGTFLGLPNPEQFFGDADYVRGRWNAFPDGALAAVIEGRLVGLNFLTNWGSVGFFGPLAVSPEYWDHGIAKRLLDATIDLFDTWGTRHAGLFTFAQSPKHVGLYQRYGFWPRFLTAVMSRRVEPVTAPERLHLVSAVPDRELSTALDEVRVLTAHVYPGLDLTREIEAVNRHERGDTLLVDDATGLQAFAICHIGAGTEAGGGNCYIKFAAVRPGPTAPAMFDRLLDGCHALAHHRGALTLVAGANAARDRAWNALTGRGFRTDHQGVTMHRPNDDGYSHRDSYIIDDWR